MNEPLVCESTNLEQLLSDIRAEHGDAANILYQDSIRRGGVMGFFAQEVHRVVFRVNAADDSLAEADDAAHSAAFSALLKQQAGSAATADRIEITPAAPVRAGRRPEPPEPAGATWLDDLLTTYETDKAQTADESLAAQDSAHAGALQAATAARAATTKSAAALTSNRARENALAMTEEEAGLAALRRATVQAAAQAKTGAAVAAGVGAAVAAGAGAAVAAGAGAAVAAGAGAAVVGPAAELTRTAEQARNLANARALTEAKMLAKKRVQAKAETPRQGKQPATVDDLDINGLLYSCDDAEGPEVRAYDFPRADTCDYPRVDHAGRQKPSRRRVTETKQEAPAAPLVDEPEAAVASTAVAEGGDVAMGSVAGGSVAVGSIAGGSIAPGSVAVRSAPPRITQAASDTRIRDVIETVRTPAAVAVTANATAVRTFAARTLAARTQAARLRAARAVPIRGPIAVPGQISVPTVPEQITEPEQISVSTEPAAPEQIGEPAQISVSELPEQIAVPEQITEPESTEPTHPESLEPESTEPESTEPTHPESLEPESTESESTEPTVRTQPCEQQAGPATTSEREPVTIQDSPVADLDPQDDVPDLWVELQAATRAAEAAVYAGESTVLPTAQDRFAALLQRESMITQEHEGIVAPTVVPHQADPLDIAVATAEAQPLTGIDAPVVSEAVQPAPESTPAAPNRDTAQVVNLPASGNPDARSRLDMVTRLREVGVPMAAASGGGAPNIYAALDEVLSELPAAPTPPRSAGDVLVIIGEIAPALRAAQSVARTLRLRDADIWVSDLESHPVLEMGAAEVTQSRSIGNPRQAARLRAEMVQGDVASIVVVATDGADANPGDPWVGEILEALRPTAVWACVDATRKQSDTTKRLGMLGDLDALVVHSAAISSSPASVWELGVPVALLDGRPAGVAGWAALLLGLLAETDHVEVPVADRDSSAPARHRSA